MAALPAEEVRALRGYRRRTTIVLSILAAVFVGLSVFVAAWATWNPDTRQHLLGRSVHTTAEVVDKREVGSCRGGTEHAYQLEWTENGSLRSESITRCSDHYSVGERIDIWSTDGMPHTQSPAMARVLYAALLVGMVAMLVWIAVAGQRVRSAVGAALSGEPPGGTFAVHGGPSGRLWAIVPSAGGEQQRRRVRSGKVLHTSGADGTPPHGVLHATRTRRGRPRGLALLVNDRGLRQWRYLA